MRRLTWSAAAVSVLMSWALASGADEAWQPMMSFAANAPASWQAAYPDFGRPAAESPQASIDLDAVTDDGVRMRDPAPAFGAPGYYLYDLDAWQAVAAGPIIGPLRQRTYSLFGADANGTSLNRLTMGSESERRNAGAGHWRGSWSNPGWSF
jgi:hypothetical protein